VIINSYLPASYVSRYFATTSVELSWTDEWLLAINLTGMTYDTVCARAIAGDQAVLDRCASDLPLPANGS